MKALRHPITKIPADKQIVYSPDRPACAFRSQIKQNSPRHKIFLSVTRLHL
jgi:hypothetical protein